MDPRLRMRSRRARQRPWVAGLWALLMMCAWALPTAPAHAATPAQVSVVFTSITPQTVGVDGSITLEGVITNNGPSNLYTVQVMTWRDTRPIRTEAALTAALAEDPQAVTGSRIEVEGSFETIVSGATPMLPGQSAQFSVTASLADLGLSQGGAYLVGVHVRAGYDQSGNFTTVGRGRVLLPVKSPSDQIPAVPMVTLVWLTSRPSFLAEGRLTDDHLADELNGRLLALVQTADRLGLNYVIDPGLYREVTTMANGYQVGEGDNAGAGQDAAKAWLAAFQKLPASRGYRLPYGDPDLSLAAATDNRDVLQRSAVAAEAVPDLEKLPLLLRSADGTVNNNLLALVADARPALVLTTLDVPGGAVASPAGTVLRVRADGYAGGPGPDTADTLMQRQQRRYATSLIASLSGSGPVVRILDDPAQAGLEEVPPADWELRTDAAAVPVAGTWDAAGPQQPSAPKLSPAVITAMDQAQTNYTQYGALIDDQDSAATLAASTLAAVPSLAWADDAQALAYQQATTAQYADFSSKVSVRVAPQIVMTSQENQFPVTVTNNLPDPVQVKITFTSSASQRISVPDTEVVTVPPGVSVTVNAKPTARANGQVEVVARLATSEGQSLGAPQGFVIKATDAGKVGWVLIIGSGIVLIGGTVWRIRTVAKSRSAGEAM